MEKQVINIAIVDDEEKERSHIRRCLDYVATAKDVEFAVTEFTSADRFVFQYTHEFDIVFLDIEFPSGMTGMQAAEAVRRIDSTVIIIFVTNMSQLAVQGYTVDALDFVVKPIDRASFLLKMTRALSRVDSDAHARVLIKTDGDTRALNIHLIKYLSVDGHYVIYHSREGNFMEYTTLAKAEKKLNSKAFYRCDRGCLVNMKYITGIGKDSCIVDGEELVIARTQKSQFLSAYVEYLGGKR